jgi:hypothetical protein
MPTIETTERETAQESTVPKMPSVETFKEIIERHCQRWHVASVENLCTQQTQDLIDELAPYFR